MSLALLLPQMTIIANTSRRSGNKESVMESYTPLKNYFGKELAVRLAQLIKPCHPRCQVSSFVSAVEQDVNELELKARVQRIADELNRNLPLEYSDQLAVLLNIVGPESEYEQGMF